MWRALGVAMLTSRWIIRQPTWLAQDLMFIAGIGFIVFAWGRSEGLAHMMAGWLVAGAIALGVNIAGQEVGYHRIMRVIDMFIASPISPREYFIGVTLGVTPFYIFELLIFTIVGLMIGYWKLLLVSYIVSLAILPVGVLLGLTVAFAVKKPGNISAITNPIVTLMTLIPPVLYPITLIPEPLRYIAIIPPTAAATQLAKTLGGIETTVNPLVPLVILATWTLATVILASRVIKWNLD